MKLMIATGNAGKLAEFRRLLAPRNIQVVSALEEKSFDMPEETGSSFAENAWLKAHALYIAFGCPALADDSGLEVEALNGAPGIYSARYAGTEATDAENNEKLLLALEGEENRRARFVCTICYIDRTGQAHYLTESCNGQIATEPRGDGGFGYDPLFLYDGRSFAELSGDEKDRVSHRSKAVRKFAASIGEWE